MTDKEIEKLAEEYAGSNYVKNHMPDTWNARKAGFITGYKTAKSDHSDEEAAFPKCGTCESELQLYNVKFGSWYCPICHKYLEAPIPNLHRLP